MDQSIGHNIKFVLKRLELLYEDPVGLNRPLDIDQFLTDFCRWQRDHNPPRDDDPLHWDHALILTGLDLYTKTNEGRINSQVVGKNLICEFWLSNLVTTKLVVITFECLINSYNQSNDRNINSVVDWLLNQNASIVEKWA